MKTDDKKKQLIALINISDQLFRCLGLLHSDWKTSSNFDALQTQLLQQVRFFRIVCSPYTCQTEPPTPGQVKMMDESLQHMENTASMTLKWLQGPTYCSVDDYTDSVINRAKSVANAVSVKSVKTQTKKPITRKKKR